MIKALEKANVQEGDNKVHIELPLSMWFSGGGGRGIFTLTQAALYLRLFYIL